LSRQNRSVNSSHSQLVTCDESRDELTGRCPLADPSMDRSRALRVSAARLPRVSNRRSRRLRHTWLRTVESDNTTQHWSGIRLERRIDKTRHARKIPHVSLSAKKTNVWVLSKAGVKRQLLDTVKARKLAYYDGHTMKKQGNCLEKEIMRGTMPGARRQGRPRTARMDNIKTWTALSVEESIKMTEDRDKWRKYVHGVANPRIEGLTPWLSFLHVQFIACNELQLLHSIIAGFQTCSKTFMRPKCCSQ